MSTFDFNEKLALEQLECGDPHEVMRAIHVGFYAVEKKGFFAFLLPKRQEKKENAKLLHVLDLANGVMEAYYSSEGLKLSTLEALFLMRVYARVIERFGKTEFGEEGISQLIHLVLELFGYIKRTEPQTETTVLLAKGILVELDSLGYPCVSEQEVFAMAEEAYRFCDNHRGTAADKKMKKNSRRLQKVNIAQRLEENLRRDSPAIRRAKAPPT